MTLVPPTIRVVHPLPRAGAWQNRSEFDAVWRWWQRGRENMCALVGVGGSAKTSVAERFLQTLPGIASGSDEVVRHDLPRRSGVFVYSLYEAPTAGTLIADLAAWLGLPSRISGPAEIAERLSERGRYLLVIDGLGELPPLLRDLRHVDLRLDFLAGSVAILDGLVA